MTVAQIIAISLLAGIVVELAYAITLLLRQNDRIERLLKEAHWTGGYDPETNDPRLDALAAQGITPRPGLFEPPEVFDYNPARHAALEEKDEAMNR